MDNTVKVMFQNKELCMVWVGGEVYDFSRVIRYTQHKPMPAIGDNIRYNVVTFEPVEEIIMDMPITNGTVVIFTKNHMEDLLHSNVLDTARGILAEWEIIEAQ